ncbi:MAG: zinc ribbon-containing protein [Nitrospirae bacterium YQR-1]
MNDGNSVKCQNCGYELEVTPQMVERLHSKSIPCPGCKKTPFVFFLMSKVMPAQPPLFFG